MSKKKVSFFTSWYVLWNTIIEIHIVFMECIINGLFSVVAMGAWYPPFLDLIKVPHWKGLKYGQYESRGLNYESTFIICQDILKNDNLLHKWGFIDSQLVATVYTHKQKNR